jgi:nicotinate-nucleotide pyrophosphorylase (carboxylating)
MAGPAPQAVSIPAELTPDYLKAKVAEALREDGATNDITTRFVVPAGLQAEAELIAKAPGVVAGLVVAEAVFGQVDLEIVFEAYVTDGANVASGDVLARLRGPLADLLSGERVALNFLQQLSGVASLTRRFRLAAGRAVVFDTRKTAPGLRPLQRYAVLVGGGCNHRYNLSGSILIKDNHVAAAGGTRAAIKQARLSGLEVEVEVETLDDLAIALEEVAEAVLLDNMTPEVVGQAVALAAGRCSLEVSGGVSLGNIAAYAATGVDRVSVGSLTHSSPALDISMEVTRTWR